MLDANAGVTQDTLLLRMSEEDWSKVIETNLTGSFRVAKRAAKGMLRLRRGRLVFISSVVQWIASDEAAYVTGAVIPVDGGLGMGH